MFRIVHKNTGLKEVLKSKAELFAALPITDKEYGLIMAGKTIELNSFLGTVTVSRIKK